MSRPKLEGEAKKVPISFSVSKHEYENFLSKLKSKDYANASEIVQALMEGVVQDRIHIVEVREHGKIEIVTIGDLHLFTKAQPTPEQVTEPSHIKEERPKDAVCFEDPNVDIYDFEEV